MKKLILKYKKSEFIKNVVIVMSGTAISQVIALALTPILTRAYTPKDFGYYTTFIAIYAILCSFVTGKYERAILLVRRERHIPIVSTLSLTISLTFSVLLFLIVFIINELGITFLSVSAQFYKWLYILPFFIFFYAINITLLTYLNYQKEYQKISTSRIIKTLVSIGSSLLFILCLKNMGGLILGEFIGLTVSTLYLFPKLRFLFQFDNYTFSLLPKFASRYKNFPRYNIPGDLLSNISNQLPVFFLTSSYGTNVTGQYSLMKRVLDAPVLLISSSILEVFREQASKLYIEQGNCRELFVKTAKNLTLISLIPFSFLFVWGTDIFVFFFGKEWYEAGMYASIFAVLYFFRFISSPLSYMFYIAEKQQIDFIIQFYMFISTFVIFYLSNHTTFTIIHTLWLYTLNFVIIYVVYFMLSYKFTKKV